MYFRRLSTLRIAPAARDWLLASRRPRWLHVFDRVCNLINENGEILSVVSPEIGEGPFNLVLEDQGLTFSDFLDIRSQVAIAPGQLTLGHLAIDTQNAVLSVPRPDWELLHLHGESISRQLMPFVAHPYPHAIPDSQLRDLFFAVAAADVASACTAARRLAGLGAGLTPAGDDVLLGAVLAAWILHPPESAAALGGAITDTAAPLTTSLSAAWLRAAGKGEAGIRWHRLFEALVSGDDAALRAGMQCILAVGHSSGADALAGFLGSMMSDVVPEYIR